MVVLTSLKKSSTVVVFRMRTGLFVACVADVANPLCAVGAHLYKSEENMGVFFTFNYAFQVHLLLP